METKLKKKGIEEVKNELKIDNVVCVDRIGMSGGLALFWDSELGVAKFDTTREPDTTRHEISRLWVEA